MTATTSAAAADRTPATDPASTPVAPSRDRRRRNRLGTGAFAVVSATVAGTALAALVDGPALRSTAGAAIDHPIGLAVGLACFGAAFAVRGWAWARVVDGLGFGQAWAAISVATGANHVLPLRLGEPMRISSVVRRAGVPIGAATSSTITLRAADLVTLAVLGLLAGGRVTASITGAWGFAAVGLLAAVGAAAAWWSLLQRRSGAPVRPPGPLTLGATAGAWLLEAVLVHEAAGWAGIDLTPAEALVVTAAGVGSQVAAVAPGGLGTYEAASVAAYVALGAAAGPALAAALAAHAAKTTWALAAGALAAAFPRPGLFAVRATRPGSAPPAAPTDETPEETTTATPEAATDAPTGATMPAAGRHRPPPEAPVVLFMPAHDEAERVGATVARVPGRVAGHPVRCVVIDDGSSDATAAVARAAGAEVVRFERNRGLGAAVRHGLDTLAPGAAAVAFCDADGEYDPAELELLVAPVLDGTADYVVGSRFAGRIDRMLPHRRLGNRALTVGLSAVARRRISDGQSGYRAFSAEAAARAEVIHDYNYAQVLTLDLLAKGFRYHEVPITYHWRRSGRSFVRPATYLRRVVPAVVRELRSAA